MWNIITTELSTAASAFYMLGKGLKALPTRGRQGEAAALVAVHSD